MPRFFADITCFPAAVITGQGAIRHIKGPLRKRKGDELAIRVGDEGYRARISSTGPNEIGVEIVGRESLQNRSSKTVHLAMSLFDMKDLEDAIRSTTELGVSSIHPVISERSSIRSVTKARYNRWQTIILEAVKQCDRKDIPLIHLPEAIDAFIETTSRNWGKRLLAHKDTLGLITENMGDDVGILVGPEGGFTPDEVQRILQAGFVPVSLGNTTLRAVTAAIAALGILGL